MGITNVNIALSKEQIDCKDSVQVTLTLEAVPDRNANDIVLVLDHSSRLEGAPLENMKQGARSFVNQLSQATSDTPNQIGLVGFSTLASALVPLGGTREALEKAITEITPQGESNHAAAFTEALKLFDFGSKRNKVLVLFTNLDATIGASAMPLAQAAKKAGVTIYCIGLGDPESANLDTITGWASIPASTHVLTTPNTETLQSHFVTLADRLQQSSVIPFSLNGTLAPDFVLASIQEPALGTAAMPTPKKLRWTIDSLDANAEQKAILQFSVQHTGQSSGKRALFKRLSYTDAEQKPVTIPTPEILVTCEASTPAIVLPEPCPIPVPVTVDRCTDSMQFDLGDALLDSLGRILQFDLTIPNVCPHRRVALAIILTEDDEAGVPQPRGMKTVTIPAHTDSGCRDITVRCIKFVVPEDTDADGIPTLCRPRHFKVQLIAHYIDTDFVCCPDPSRPQPEIPDPTVSTR